MIDSSNYDDDDDNVQGETESEQVTTMINKRNF